MRTKRLNSASKQTGPCAHPTSARPPAATKRGRTCACATCAPAQRWWPRAPTPRGLGCSLTPPTTPTHTDLHKGGGRELGDGLGHLGRACNARQHGRHARLNVAVALQLEHGRHGGPRRLLDLHEGFGRKKRAGSRLRAQERLALRSVRWRNDGGAAAAPADGTCGSSCRSSRRRRALHTQIHAGPPPSPPISTSKRTCSLASTRHSEPTGTRSGSACCTAALQLPASFFTSLSDPSLVCQLRSLDMLSSRACAPAAQQRRAPLHEWRRPPATSWPPLGAGLQQLANLPAEHRVGLGLSQRVAPWGPALSLTHSRHAW